MRTESNMTKARRIVEENEIKLGACMLKPERERFIESCAKFIEFMTPEQWALMRWRYADKQTRRDVIESFKSEEYHHGLPVDRKAAVEKMLLILCNALPAIERTAIFKAARDETEA